MPNEEEIRSTVVSVIGRLAPEAPLGQLEPSRRLRDQFDFDSVDFLNFALGLQEAFKVRIPETDYPKLATLQGCIDYVGWRLRQER